MNNQFTSPFNLRRITELFAERERNVTSEIKNLKIADVKDDAAFEHTKKRLHKEAVIDPVVFEEPQYVDHEYVQGQSNMLNQFYGMGKDNYVHKVKVSFKGDSELFEYQPNTLSYSSNEHGMIMPSGHSLYVYVTFPAVNPKGAVAEANNLLGMTKRIVGDNSTAAHTWSQNFTNRMDGLLEQKRTELINAFS